ncbi:MAG: decaprenylphospho-beta-D-erythro-pentofuranosid-2-ulose 2-reductase [Actinomycetia bacterium]|nr:decaprenylphospho-beta-D-erythro-pentofuranosid-2-ulose 2-reductase [Actinomycetes bacterium]
MIDALGAPQSILLLGGTSEIGLAIVDRFVESRRVHTVFLASRLPERSHSDAERLRAAGVSTVETVAFDSADIDQHRAVVDDVWGRHGDIDVTVLAFGVLGDQADFEENAEAAADAAIVNYAGAVSVGLLVAEKLRAQGHGRLVVLSSVAGERARRSNFVYGSTKAGLDTFAVGLGDALVGSGAKVHVVRPGFVKGRMTAHLDAAPLATTPEAVADAVAGAVASGKEEIWVPGPLRFVMSGLRHVPRKLFRRLPI